MANVLSAVAPRLLAQGLLALRQVAVMPGLVNSSYTDMAGERGSSIDIPIPSAIAAQVVAPGNTPPSTADVQPVNVSIVLNNWYEAPFYLTDQDMLVAMEGTIPMQASEAIKSLANRVNQDILAQYVNFYGFNGTPGTTPFSATVDATTTRKLLNKQLAPINDRRFVLNPDAEANAINLAAFQYYLNSGDKNVMQEGQIGRKFGFDWYMHQLVPTHPGGTLGGGALTVTSNTAAGTSNLAESTQTLAITNTGGTGASLIVGDILTFAGDTQTYVVTAAATIAASASVNVTVAPQLQVAQLATNAVTLKAAHVANIAFHRDAIAFATRPLTQAAEGLGHIIQSASDPLSKLTLRLEISREYKRTRFSYDILYGVTTLRRELGCRLAG